MLKTLLLVLLGSSTPDSPTPGPSPIRPAQPLPTLAECDLMEDTAFETYLAGLFGGLGYHVERTPHADQGADLILIRDGVRTAVRIERWNVELHAVRAVIASMLPYNCTRALVVTNSSNFTVPATTACSCGGARN